MVLRPEWGHLRENKPFCVRILLGTCPLILHYTIHDTIETEARYKIRFAGKNEGKRKKIYFTDAIHFH